MRPAHRCRAEGGLHFVVHAYGPPQSCAQLGAAEQELGSPLCFLEAPGMLAGGLQVRQRTETNTKPSLNSHTRDRKRAT